MKIIEMKLLLEKGDQEQARKEGLEMVLGVTRVLLHLEDGQDDRRPRRPYKRKAKQRLALPPPDRIVHPERNGKPLVCNYRSRCKVAKAQASGDRPPFVNGAAKMMHHNRAHGKLRGDTRKMKKGTR